MRIAVTGACGFVGSTIIRRLVPAFQDLHITGIDNFIRDGSRDNRIPLEQLGARVIEGDIRNPEDLEQIGAVDWVIDCAAEPSVLAGIEGKTTSFELMDHNLIGTIRLLEFCKKTRAGFILMSTSRVYSIAALAAMPVESTEDGYRPIYKDAPQGISEAGISEAFPTSPPTSLYGVSKRCSELLALEYGSAFGFPVWINRCGVLAGAGQFGRADQGIFSFWIKSWKHGKPLQYIGFDGKGSQVRDCLHPADLIPLLRKQMTGHDPRAPGDGLDPRVCNVSGGTQRACSLSQLSSWCRGRFGTHEVMGCTSPRPFDLPWVVLDSSRAERMWDWRPRTALTDIFEEIASE